MRDTLARAASEGQLVAFLADSTVKRIRASGLLSEAELKQEAEKARKGADAYLTRVPRSRFRSSEPGPPWAFDAPPSPVSAGVATAPYGARACAEPGASCP